MEFVYFLEENTQGDNDLVASLKEERYKSRRFEKLPMLESACFQDSPSALIIYKNIPPIQEDLLALKGRLSSENKPAPLIIIINEKSDFEARLASVYAGGDFFFSNPANHPEVIQCLKKNTNEKYFSHPKVLFIENPERPFEKHRALLLKNNIEVERLLDYSSLIASLEEYQPHMVIVDFHLHSFLAVETLRIIRQNSSWKHIRLLCLIDSQEAQLHNVAIDAGADTVLANPVSPSLLLSVVKSKMLRVGTDERTLSELGVSQRESEFLSAALNEHAIVSITDIGGRITEVNKKFCQISGYSREELIGQNHRILRSDYHNQDFYQEMWGTIAAGKIWHGTICNKNKNGGLYWVNSTIISLPGKDGKPCKYASIRTDITELRLSESRYKLGQSYANIGTWDWNIQTNELFWSDQIAPLFGYSDRIPETTYENFLANIHPEDREMVTHAIDQCVHYDENYDIQHRVIWADGSIHWMHERGNVMRNADGAPMRMLGVVEDVTSQKADQIALIKQENRLKNAQRIGRIGDYSWDTETGDISMSEESCRITCLAPNEIQSIDDVFTHFHPDDQESMRQATEEALECGYSSSDFRVVAPNGETRWVHCERQAKTDQAGKTTGLRGTLQDITERKQFEHELLKAKEGAEKANHAKSTFLASMSHELRTPLNAIMGFSQLLEMNSDNNLSPLELENVGEILSASGHLLDLINEILELAKIESGNIELSLEEFNVNEVILECIELTKHSALQHGIKIFWNNKGAEQQAPNESRFRPVVIADRIRLKQVILNLLSNAVKYNCNNGQISIFSSTVIDKNLIISVSDTGVGLSKDQRSHLFEPFNRLGAETLDKEGTGIGLTICKKLIESMNGDINVESEPGKGSSFQVQIPVAAAPTTKNTAIKSNSNNKNNLLAFNKVQPEPGRFTVLYIEDNPVNLRLVEKIFTKLDHVEFVCASEPLTGLGLAALNNPDLILLDINLPILDGYETLKRIRDIRIHHSTPVIAISAHAHKASIQKALDAGFHDYITKPIEIEQFLSIVEENLSKAP